MEQWGLMSKIYVSLIYQLLSGGITVDVGGVISATQDNISKVKGFQVSYYGYDSEMKSLKDKCEKLHKYGIKNLKDVSCYDGVRDILLLVDNYLMRHALEAFGIRKSYNSMLVCKSKYEVNGRFALIQIPVSLIAEIFSYISDDDKIEILNKSYKAYKDKALAVIAPEDGGEMQMTGALQMLQSDYAHQGAQVPSQVMGDHLFDSDI